MSMEFTEAYYLKIHWDNHHCSSCHEASDEWNRHYVLQNMAEVNAAIAQALANPEAKRGLTVGPPHWLGNYAEVLKCPAVKDGLEIYLLTDPTDEERPIKGEPVQIDLVALQNSPDYEKARIAKVLREEQAKRDAAEATIRHAEEAKRKQEEDDLRKLAELKAKYEGRP